MGEGLKRAFAATKESRTAPAGNDDVKKLVDELALCLKAEGEYQDDVFLDRDEAKAVLTAHMAKRGLWQTIDTAPSHKKVLVYGVTIDGTKGWYTIAERHSGIWYEENDEDIKEPTHWMPLPDAPKTGGDV